MVRYVTSSHQHCQVFIGYCLHRQFWFVEVLSGSLRAIVCCLSFLGFLVSIFDMSEVEKLRLQGESIGLEGKDLGHWIMQQQVFAREERQREREERQAEREKEVKLAELSAAVSCHAAVHR